MPWCRSAALFALYVKRGRQGQPPYRALFADRRLINVSLGAKHIVCLEPMHAIRMLSFFPFPFFTPSSRYILANRGWRRRLMCVPLSPRQPVTDSVSICGVLRVHCCWLSLVIISSSDRGGPLVVVLWLWNCENSPQCGRKRSDAIPTVSPSRPWCGKFIKSRANNRQRKLSRKKGDNSCGFWFCVVVVCSRMPYRRVHMW